MRKEIFIFTIISLLILVSPALALTGNFYPTSGQDTSKVFAYTLTPTDLAQLVSSDNSRYKSQDQWWNPYYEDNKYIDFIFTPNLPYNATTINGTVLTFEWQRDSVWVLGARIHMWDQSSGTWHILDIATMGDAGIDKTETIDMSSFINTRDDVNNLKIRFQAKDGTCINGGSTLHDLVKITVNYDEVPCSSYGTSGICDADSNCDWCSSCSANQYSGGSDRCVNAGTCNYFCEYSPTPFCGATCEINSDCANYCSGNTRYYSGNCLSGCSCSYTSENCDSLDGWYNTTTIQWIETGECTEKEQLQQQYRDYSCSPSGCIFSVTNTQWIDTGATRNKPNGTVCDDGLWCTVSDQCGSGTCSGSAKDCGDGVSCTVDTCNEAADQCVHTTNNSFCNNGFYCDGNEYCDATLGCKAGTPVNCADSIGCTIDSCDETQDQCTHAENNTFCNDNLFCNGLETCSATLGCLAGTSVNCNDNVTCTADSCNETADTCNHVPNNSSCNDGFFCNGIETCNIELGCMQGISINCTDSIGCTADSCNETADQCSHAANNTYCNNGFYCDGQEYCDVNLGCMQGTPINCSGNNIFGISTCDNNPDNFHFTFDFRNPFTSICAENGNNTGYCTLGNMTITHTCDKPTCNAPCDVQNPCANNTCSQTYSDYCNEKKLVEYNCNHLLDNTTVNNSCSNTCNLETCGCSNCTTSCPPPQTNSYCVFNMCGAECDEQNPCQNKCVDNLRYYSGSCTSGCLCSYSTENCGQYNGCYAYGTGCEDRTYSCSPSNCTYNYSNRSTDYNESAVQYCSNGELRSHNQLHNFYCNGICSDHVTWTGDQLIDNCNNHDGWYNTTDTQWVATCQCTEKEQQKQEYRDYSCDPSGCIYNVTDTAWIDTGATRNKPNGTPCNDGFWCTTGDSCSNGTCAGGPRNCHETPDILCTLDSCNETIDQCIRTPDNSYCNDNLYCNGQEYCNATTGCMQGTPINCSGNNISGIATCFNNPDNVNYTWDFRNPFTSTCINDGDNQGHCTNENSTITHTCSVSNCGAECDSQNPCQNKCIGNVRYFNGNCLSGCSCSYTSENCDLQDGWYNTTTTQWIDTTQCTEKEQLMQEYKDYSCAPSGCTQSVTGTKWVDTGATRNKEDGTTCDDGILCTENDVCTSGICSGTTTDTEYPQVLYLFSGKDWVGLGDTFYVDSKIIDDTADCIAPKCLVKILDNENKTAYIQSNLEYVPEIQKCRGFVTVNDTFHESSAYLIIDVWDSGNHYNTSRTMIGIDNSKLVNITGIDNIWYSNGYWINNVTATVNSTVFGVVKTCLVDISGSSPENTMVPSGNKCIGNIRIPAGISDGSKKLTIKAVNINGKIINDSVNIQIDNNPPYKEIFSPVNDTIYSSQIPIIVNSTDEFSGSKNGSYRIVQDPWRLFGLIPIPGTDYDSGWIGLTYNGTTYNDYFSTSPLESGRTYYLSVVVCDNAGNCVDPVVKFDIDKNPPTWADGSTLIVTYSPYDKDGNIGLSWPVANDESVIDHYNVFVYNSTGHMLFSYSTTQTSYQLIGLVNGMYSFKVTAVDSTQPVGNENSGLTGSTTVDRSCAVDVTCTQSGGGDGGAGSGGSGGGGSSSGGSGTTTTGTLSLTLPSSKDTIAGYIDTTTVKVTNSGYQTVSNVKVTFTGIPSDWISISPSSADIGGGKTSDYIVTISVPVEATAGKNTVTFTATTPEGKSVSRNMTLYITTLLTNGIKVTSGETICGNGICETGEDQSNCCSDCNCISGYECKNNTCSAGLSDKSSLGITGMIVGVFTNPIVLGLIFLALLIILVIVIVWKMKQKSPKNKTKQTQITEHAQGVTK